VAFLFEYCSDILTPFIFRNIYLSINLLIMKRRFYLIAVSFFICTLLIEKSQAQSPDKNYIVLHSGEKIMIYQGTTGSNCMPKRR